VIPRLAPMLRAQVYNSPSATGLDAFLSRCFAWNVNYHPRSKLQQLRPTSVVLVMRKA
jgi:hypothetical protein